MNPRQHPPDLSRRPDLEQEDLFLHRHGKKREHLQIWVWVNEGDVGFHWKRVHEGFKRPSDGRMLALTDAHQKPAWWTRDWFRRQKKRRERSECYYYFSARRR